MTEEIKFLRIIDRLEKRCSSSSKDLWLDSCVLYDLEQIFDKIFNGKLKLASNIKTLYQKRIETLKSFFTNQNSSNPNPFVLQEIQSYKKEVSIKKAPNIVVIDDDKAFKLFDKNVLSTSQTQTSLEKESLLRDQITREMIAYANEIKLQSKSLNDQLKVDIKLLDETSDIMTKNEASLNEINSELKNTLGNTCGCFVFILFILTFVVFIQMVFIIRLFGK